MVGTQFKTPQTGEYIFNTSLESRKQSRKLMSDFPLLNGAYALGTTLLFPTLIALTIIDAKRQILPNILTIPLILAGFLYHFTIGTGLMSSVLGAGIGYASFVAIEIGYKHFRGIDGLGRGDAKLLAAGGAWVGALSLPYILLVASLSALAVVLVRPLLGGPPVTATTKLAFGPYLCLGIAAVWLSSIA